MVDAAVDAVETDGEASTDAAPDAGADGPVWHAPCPTDSLEERLIDVGEVRLNVACRGAGPTIVFLHGFPEFHYAYYRVMEALAGEFRLVAPDQRGYNLSDKPEAVDAYALPELADDILRLLPLISPDPVILVAHDWGGPVGWLVAHTPGAHLRAFVSTNGPHPIRFTQLIANDDAQRMASEYMEFFRSPAAESFFTLDRLSTDFAFLDPEAMARYRAAWAQPGAITGGLNWYRANSLDEAALDGIMAGRSPTVSVPTVVMWGLDDQYVLSSNAEGLEAFVPDLEVETFEGVDHWIAHRIPDEIARVLRALDAETSLASP
jgi:pimeloyl-ACP methyl ester carboxylesterase